MKIIKVYGYLQNKCSGYYKKVKVFDNEKGIFPYKIKNDKLNFYANYCVIDKNIIPPEVYFNVSECQCCDEERWEELDDDSKQEDLYLFDDENDFLENNYQMPFYAMYFLLSDKLIFEDLKTYNERKNIGVKNERNEFNRNN